MKTIKSSLIVIVLIVTMSFSNSSDIIDRINSAHGNLSSIAKINDQEQIWVMTDSKGNSFKCLYKYKRPNKLRIDVHMMDGTLLLNSIFNGTIGVQNIFGNKRNMTSDEIKEYTTRTYNWIDGYYKFKEKGYKLNALPDITLNGIKYFVLELIDKFNNIQKITVNSKSFLIENVEEQQIDVVSQIKVLKKIVYQDYKEVEGVFYPSKMIITDKDGNVQVLKLEKLTNNKGVNDNEFKI